jgi:hypothetical protein
MPSNRIAYGASRCFWTAVTLLTLCVQSLIPQGNITNQAAPHPAKPHALKLKGIDNLFRLSNHIYSGAAPENAEAFGQLQKLGIITILSVDGSKPDIDLAHRYGLRYVHIPHGYEGIDAETQIQLIKAAQSLPGPLFVHCHHGQHRGPAAAAVICMGTEGWTPTEGESWLKTAGTSPDYQGLYETVRRFQPPSVTQINSAKFTFSETANVSDLVDAMVHIDAQWDNLRAIRKEGYLSPRVHSDLRPLAEVVLMKEHFREAQRLEDAKRRGKNFLEGLKSTEAELEECQRLLKELDQNPTANLRESLDRSFNRVGASCTACHKNFRDGPVVVKSH